MNLDYKMALERAQQLIDNGNLEASEIEYIFPELGCTEEQKQMAKLLDLLANMHHFGKDANFDAYDKSDVFSWINIIRKTFFELPKRNPTVNLDGLERQLLALQDTYPYSSNNYATLESAIKYIRSNKIVSSQQQKRSREY